MERIRGYRLLLALLVLSLISLISTGDLLWSTEPGEGVVDDAADALLFDAAVDDSAADDESGDDGEGGEGGGLGERDHGVGR